MNHDPSALLAAHNC